MKFGNLISLLKSFRSILKSEFVCLVRFSNILIALSFFTIRLSIIRVCPSDKIKSTNTFLFCPNRQNLLIAFIAFHRSCNFSSLNNLSSMVKGTGAGCVTPQNFRKSSTVPLKKLESTSFDSMPLISPTGGVPHCQNSHSVQG